MNNKAYYAGQRAASEHYLLTGHLLDMHAEEETAQQERARCTHDFEIWYWNGQLDYIREFQAGKQAIQSQVQP